jgi:tRNA (cytidine/uridine-2'-O-)-methyltransferase
MPKIVLIAPEIPGNTGSIGRTCVALNFELIIVGKAAFDLSEKAVRRAGLDYWKYVQIKHYENWEKFLEGETPHLHDLYFLENHHHQTIYHAHFSENSYLILGAETTGIPSEILSSYQERIFSLPMFSSHIRSLNLANAATAVAYEVIRQIRI